MADELMVKVVHNKRPKGPLSPFEDSAVAESYAQSRMHRKGATLLKLVSLVESFGSVPRILDLGGGTGHLARALQSTSTAGYVVDSSLAMEIAGRGESGFEAVRSICALAQDLPFAESTFSVAVSRLAFHHFRSVDTVLRELKRVLAADGMLLIADVAVPEDPAQGSFVNELQHLRDPTHIRSLPVSEWLFLLEASGFAVRHIEYGYLDGPRRFADWLDLTRVSKDTQYDIVDCIRTAEPEHRVAIRLFSEPSTADELRHLSFEFPRVILQGEAVD